MEYYIKTRSKIIYSFMKTVCNNTDNFVRLKTHIKYMFELKLIKTHTVK